MTSSESGDELELKARVDDPAALEAAIVEAGAELVFRGEMIDRRYDRRGKLEKRDEVLRLRVYKPDDGPPFGVLGWKGPGSVRDGYKHREEHEVQVAQPEAARLILERLRYEVVVRIDRKIAEYRLGGAAIRIEWYPALRVPELAPSLGRIIVPRRLFDPWVPLDDIREELATRVLELGGDGRAAAAREAEGGGQDRARILDVTGRRAWAAAWENAVRRAGARVADALAAEITRTARQVRLPRRRLRRHLLSNAEKRAIVARLGTGGGTFVAALDALETAAGRVTDASVLEKDAHAEWQEALRTVARRLEAAWLALEAEVEEEHTRWTPEIDAVAAWRPLLWPIFVVWTPLSILLVWLGLILGGYLPAPAWLAAQLGF